MLRRHRASKKGFTLVELLVVIGILALLIALLLPALARVKRQASAIKCSSNLRSLGQAMMTYASENRGAIPGGAWTTARFMFVNGNPGITGNVLTGSGTNGNPPWGTTNLPNLVQVHDWMSPLARYLRVNIPFGHTVADRRKRFETFSTTEPFKCPDNTFLASAFSTGLNNWGVQQHISYSMPLVFSLRRTQAGVASGTGLTTTPSFYNVPFDYSPSITSIGKASKKIFALDGARFCTASPASKPTYDVSITATYGGSFAEFGAWSTFTRAWDRQKAGGQNLTGPGSQGTWANNIDGRIYAFRHGNLRPFSSVDAMKLNAVFFDGHAELLGDLEVSNPVYWMPKGTEVVVSEMFPDTKRVHLSDTSATTYVIPE